MKKQRIWIAAFLTCLFVPTLGLYAQIKQASFWGTAVLRGVSVTSANQIKAYDPRGQLCGEANGNNGYFLIYAHGVYDGSPYPGGANSGEAITLRIDGSQANIVSGSNIWVEDGDIECNIEVPVGQPSADPGGPYSGSEGSPIQFDGSGSVGGSHSWNFGDGNTGSGTSPVHTYLDNGTYTVTLTVQNSMGTDTKTTTATIQNVAPTASASADMTNINQGETVQFTGDFSDPGVLDTHTFHWNFGDGATSTSRNPSHQYTAAGTRNVTFTVTDKDGGTGTDHLTITVNNLPPQNVNAGPNQTVNEGQTVQFSGSATPGWPGDQLTYSWNFGDTNTPGGGTGSGQNPTHVYPDNGVFTVTLSVSDGVDIVTDQMTVTVNNVPPTANAGGPYFGVINHPVQFQGSATDPGSIDRQSLVFAWDMTGNGQYTDRTGTNPAWTFTSTGVYTVSLRVTDKDGGTGFSNAVVNVNEGVQIIIATDPAVNNLTVMVGGHSYSAPHTFYAIPGSQVEIGAKWDQYVETGVRYHYRYWNHGGDRIQTITVPEQNTTYTVVYLKQMYLDIQTGGVDAETEGKGWYAEGQRVTISVEPYVTNPQGKTRHSFASWAGSGHGAYNGTERTKDIHIYSPIVQHVNWNTEHYLEINTPVGNPKGEGWHTEGSQVEISVDSAVTDDGLSRYSFYEWQGQGQGSYSGSANPAAVIVNGPLEQTVVWQAQHYLDVQSEYGKPVGGGWYDQGDIATVTIDTSVTMPEGSRARFLRWTGTGTGSYTGENVRFEVAVNRPITQTAQWKSQYYLSVLSERGTPTGEGWYDKGQLVHFSVDSADQINETERYSFYAWTGAGNGHYLGYSRNASIIIENPVTQTAQWKKQYFLSTAIEPADGGTVEYFHPPGGWGNANEYIILKAVGNASKDYGFKEWTGDVESLENPISLFLDQPKSVIAHFMQGEVRIQTEPSGLNIVADGEDYIAPVVLDWNPGETYLIEAVSPQGDNVKSRFIFREWNTKQPRQHYVIIPDQPVTYTAYFDAFYYLKVESEHGTATGEGWYEKGSSADVSIASMVYQSDFIRWLFAGWTGVGDGSVTSTDRDITVKVNEPVTQTAVWRPQFKLSVSVFPGNAEGFSIDINPPGPWYDPGDMVELTVTVEDANYVFTGWSGDAEGDSYTITVTMQNAVNVTANFDVPNQAPVISNFPLIYLQENEPFIKTFSWLENYVKDDNEPIEDLIYTFSENEYISGSVDKINKLFILTPEENWYGETQLMMTVQDGFGLSAEKTLYINVLQADRPPGNFTLIAPRDTTVNQWPVIMRFTWSKPENIHLIDSVFYNFYISSNPSLTGPGTFVVSWLPDTTLLVTIREASDYYWSVWAEDLKRNRTRADTVYQVLLATTGVDDFFKLPEHFELSQNYPNPFNPGTTISYQIPERTHTSLVIYNLLGQPIRKLVDMERHAGFYTAEWDGKDEKGVDVSTGIYIYRLIAGMNVETKRMVKLQ